MRHKADYDVLLTVHLSIILVINQLNAQNLCFKISLLNASTCFQHYALIIRRSKLYYTASGIITPVGGRPVHRTATYRSPQQRCKRVEAHNKSYYKTGIFCIKLANYQESRISYLGL